jgi:hypothetical protein
MCKLLCQLAANILHILEPQRVQPAFAFDGARKGWQRMAGEGLRELLAQAA